MARSEGRAAIFWLTVRRSVRSSVIKGQSTRIVEWVDEPRGGAGV